MPPPVTTATRPHVPLLRVESGLVERLGDRRQGEAVDPVQAPRAATAQDGVVQFRHAAAEGDRQTGQRGVGCAGAAAVEDRRPGGLQVTAARRDQADPGDDGRGRRFNGPCSAHRRLRRTPRASSRAVLPPRP